MKKRLVLIVNVVLILAILGGIFFVMFKTSSIDDRSDESVPTQEVTEVVTEAEPTEPPVVYTVGVIQRSDIPNCNEIYKGFLGELGDKGYVNGSTMNIDYVLEEDTNKCKEAIQRFIDSEYDLIVTIGPLCTKLAASMTSDIPIIFAAVEEPEQEEYVESNEAPGKNVTGVSDYTPCFEQIGSIKQMFPDTQKIGAIYYATNTESLTQAIIGEKEASTEEINLPYEKYPVKSKKDLQKKLATMIDEDGVDVIYAPVDSFVTKNLDTVLSITNEKKVPVVCGNLEMLKKGCFSTSVINYPSIGGAAADLALGVLYDGVDPATTPITYIVDCYLHINEESMNELSLTLPADVTKRAIIE